MAKISLCLIVGNVEEYIERCLASFKPIADEIICVRAIGCAPPDKTLDIAREKFGAITAEYKNADGHEDWPHVDSFAAARQMSFDLATGDYCFWCDTDDVLESGAEVVRELANRGGYPAFVFPYKIFGKGMLVPRERMILKDAGRWKFPVHECFDFHIKPAHGIEDNRVVVTHMPHLEKTGSNDRNLRILKAIPEAEMTTGLWYHLHLELALAKDNEGSVAAAKRALEASDIGKAEKYEIFLNLAQMTDDPRQKEVFLHRAYEADPERREALCLLTNNALNYNVNARALAYARQMMATAEPKSIEWNNRKPVYGWVGEDLYCQALRANGEPLEAEKVRRAMMSKYGCRISLIHATRGRFEQAARARKIWLDLAEKPEQVEHLFVMDADDEDSAPLRRMHHITVPAGGGCVHAWNVGALQTVAPIMVQMSDDWIPPQQWDKLIVERFQKYGDIINSPMVLAVNDGHRKDDLLCMAVCTRNYFCFDHYLFHPWFTGVYSDNWFTKKAYERGLVIDARDIVFTHNHPAFDSNVPVDKTYAEQNAEARYVEGKRIYDELLAGKDFSTVPGWCNFWPVYRELARRMPEGSTFVEVGVWLGRSIIYLAQELKRLNKRCRLIAVDTFKGEVDQPAHYDEVAKQGGSVRAAFEANLKRCEVADMVEVIEGDSADSAARFLPRTVWGCFIDAAHDYESVKRDISAWMPKVKPEGFFGGHDADQEPVAKAVVELLPRAKMSGSCWYL